MTIRSPFAFLAAAACSLLFASLAAGQTARFVSPATDVVSEEGTVDLIWEAAGPLESENGVVFEARRWLAGAPGENSGVLAYEGRDTSTFVSGLLEGNYVFKVRARSAEGEFAPWSEEDALAVEVVFHSRGKVLTMLIAGAATLAITVGSIAIGHRRMRRV